MPGIGYALYWLSVPTNGRPLPAKLSTAVVHVRQLASHQHVGCSGYYYLAGGFSPDHQSAVESWPPCPTYRMLCTLMAVHTSGRPLPAKLSTVHVRWLAGPGRVIAAIY
jgi:hypothetical protein